eukprot:758727-Rhodomonas_salina.4
MVLPDLLLGIVEHNYTVLLSDAGQINPRKAHFPYKLYHDTVVLHLIFAAFADSAAICGRNFLSFSRVVLLFWGAKVTIWGADITFFVNPLRELEVCAYARGMRCPVLTRRMVIPDNPYRERSGPSDPERLARRAQ